MMTPLHYVGLAYFAIWIGVMAFVLRLSRTSADLGRRIEDLERAKRT